MKKAPQSQVGIGRLIRDIREVRGMSQAQFAKLLKTSQSAVARMEQGNQNFSTALLEKVGDILGRRVVAGPVRVRLQDTGWAAAFRRGYGQYVEERRDGAVVRLAFESWDDNPSWHSPRRRDRPHAGGSDVRSGCRIRDFGSGSIEIKVPEALSVKGIDAATAAKMRSTLMLWGGLST